MPDSLREKLKPFCEESKLDSVLAIVREHAAQIADTCKLNRWNENFFDDRQDIIDALKKME